MSDTLPARMINVGCGNRFHPAWINLDIAPQKRGVIKCDLTRGLPFPDHSCDVVYHSNVIEHLRREDALDLLRECRRVLKPGGILRVAAPDLQRICELYLEKVHALEHGEATAIADYDWILLEMFDQTVREKPGGGMLDFLRQNPLPNEPFVLERIGQEGREIIESLRNAPPAAPPWLAGLKRVYRRPRHIFEWLGELVRMLCWGSRGARAFRIGRFRLSGEVHHWMYDRYSLARLMRAAGFPNPTLQSAAVSGIPGWEHYHLDVSPGGAVIKPDSFFMEATNPE